MENWLTVLIIVVILMGISLALLPHIERTVKGRKSRPPARTRSGLKRAAPANYGLAPKHPDVMAAALFELLSLKLSFKEINAFADLVLSQEMTERYLERLAAKSSLAGFADKLAYLCNSMQVNGFTPEDRSRVSQALLHKARKEYKLLKIQKNLDEIF